MGYAAMKPTKPGLEETQEQIQKIRITLSSKNVKNLEKGLRHVNKQCEDLLPSEFVQKLVEESH